jgi:hypothetical protein
MMLVDEGKLKLEDKINKYFTDAPPEWEQDNDPPSVCNTRRGWARDPDDEDLSSRSY